MAETIWVRTLYDGIHTSFHRGETASQNFAISPVTLTQIIAICLLPLVIFALAMLYPIALLCQGAPFLHRSERMKSCESGFYLLKIRTMSETSGPDRVLGGDQSSRVTKLGKFLRLSRLDELPQIFNVIRGDMVFFGPRPPLRRYVEAYPILYAQVLAQKPGVTGLATIVLNGWEGRVLAKSMDPTQTTEIYERRCVPRKAALDLLHQRKGCIALNVLILVETVLHMLHFTKPRKVRRLRKLFNSSAQR